MPMENNKKNNNLGIIIGAVVALIVIFGLVYFANKGEKKESTKSAESASTQTTTNKEDLEKVDLPQLSDKVSDDEAEVKMITDEGDITIKLFPKYAPLAVENFLTHSKNNYYNGVDFFRVMNDFMIQGGDPKNNGNGGESIWKGKDDKIDAGTGFKNEVSNNLFHLRGALSMANAGPDTNGSQFFIVQNSKDMSSRLQTDQYPSKIIEEYKKGGYPSLDKNYSVFGQVISGMDVVDKIAGGETTANDSGNEKSKPVNPVKIKSIEVIKDYDFKK